MNEEPVLRILVADDESGMRAGMRRTLEGMRVRSEDGLEYRLTVDEAADGKQTRQKLAAGGVDLLLLDHSMPGSLGMDILQDLRGPDGTGEPEPLTIMVTAYASLEMAVKATKQGAFDFLAKPFNPAELRRVVDKAAGHLLAARTARDLARQKHQVRFEFISILAHELKAPLGAVEGYLRLLEEGVTRDQPEATLRMVGRSLARLEGMRKLIYDLLDLTRIESGRHNREPRDLDLGTLLPGVLETFAPQAAARGITLELEVRGDARLHADPGELTIIFNNLVSNAVKYNRDNGRVQVTVDGGGDGGGSLLTVTVQDTGIGLTEEEAGRLFGEFVRIRNDKTSAILGSGLGLSIVRRLARLCGGDVTVRSEPDVGSAFTVTLGRGGEVAS